MKHTLGLSLTILLVSSMVMGASSVLPALPVHALFCCPIIITNATYGTLGSFNAVEANLANIGPSSLNLVVFAVWKNSASQTVAITTGGLTLASAETGIAWAPLASPPPSGTYTVNVFAVTTNNLPDSPTFLFSVTI